MSLTSCIKKAGKALNADDKAAILAAARRYRTEGQWADDAARQAVRERIAEVQAMLDRAEGREPATTEAAPAPAAVRGGVRDIAPTGRESASLERQQGATALQRLNADYAADRIDAATHARHTEAFASQAAPTPVARGTEAVREALRSARGRGEVSAEAVDFALWALDRNPALAEGLAVSVRPQEEAGVSGIYSPSSEIVSLFQGKAKRTTAVHEILHHTERMMPPEVQAGIMREWSRQYSAAVAAARGNDPLIRALGDIAEVIVGNDAAFQRLIVAFADGTLDYDQHYPLTSPSEFWAVKATDILSRRHAADSWIGQARQWLSEMMEKVKGLLGIASDSSVLKGLQAVLDGKGEKLSPGLMAERLTSLRQITPAQAMQTGVAVAIPSDPLFAEAVANTPSASITPDGLLINLVRYQRPEQEGAQAIRTGVFYLPSGSPAAKHYKTGKTGYGGSEKFEGETLLRAPLFVKGATGGKAPEVAYDQIKGKKAYEAMRRDVLSAAVGYGKSRQQKVEGARQILEKYGADPSLAYEIVEYSPEGNTLPYALQENIVAHAVRAAGYDSVVGYSKGKTGATISEVFDVREQTFPARGMDSEIHDDFVARDVQRPAASKARSSTRAPDQTKTEAFRKWFGQSVVTKDGKAGGEPLVVYHGTGGDFSVFSKGNSFWGSASPSLANDYADLRAWDGTPSSVMPLYMRAESPFDADALPKAMNVGTFFSEVRKQAVTAGREVDDARANELIRVIRAGAIEEESGPTYERHDFWNRPNDMFGTAGANAVRELFDLMGFDSVKMTEGGSTTFGVFRPEQIKSATGNAGTFDPTNPDIRAATTTVTTRATVPPAVEFDDELLDVAIADSRAAPSLIQSDIDGDAQGVMPGKLRMLDRGLKEGRYYSEEDVSRAWDKTRELIRSRYGDKVTLYRADAPAASRGGLTAYFADETTAKKFERENGEHSRRALPYEINVDDILAVYARRSGYYEVIVRRPEGGFKPRQTTPNDPSRAAALANPDSTAATVPPAAQAKLAAGPAAVDWLATKAADPAHRAIAEKLRPFIGDNVRVHFPRDGETLPDDVAARLGADAGAVAHLHPDGSSDLYFRPGTEPTQTDLLHELIHAATEKAFSAPDAEAVRAELNGVLKAVRTTFAKVAATDAVNMNRRQQAEFFAAVLDHPSELLAYAHSSPTLREWLRHMNADGTFSVKPPPVKQSLWQRLVDLVRRALGISGLYSRRLGTMMNDSRGAAVSGRTGGDLYQRLDALLQAAMEAQGVPGVERLANLTAYHGSPHKFDKFSLDKIGTGEGAQAFGHGLYFSSVRDIAEHYRKSLSNSARGGLRLAGAVPPTPGEGLSDNAWRAAEQLSELLVSESGDVKTLGELNVVEQGRVLSVMHRLIEENKILDAVVSLVPVEVVNVLGAKKRAPDYLLHYPTMLVHLLPRDAHDLVPSHIPAVDVLASAVALAAAKVHTGLGRFDVSPSDFLSASGALHSRVPESVSGKIPKPSEFVKGALYEVDIPEDGEYLLFDSPLSEQPEQVKKALGVVDRDHAAEDALISEAKRRGIPPTDMPGYAELEDKMDAAGVFSRKTGEEFYRETARELGGDKAASEYLHSLGIAGIKYLDGTSRKAGEGHYNYVVFDDSRITISQIRASRAAVDQTQTPAFQRWFGDSKVVDAEGKPLVVYHTTTYGDFDAFDKASQRKGMAGFGFYFTDRDGANIYADYAQNFQNETDWKGSPKRVNTMPVYLRVSKPLRADDIADVLAKYGARDKGSFGVARQFAGLTNEEKTAIQKAGYDGVIAVEHVKRQRNGSYKVVAPGTKGALSHPVYVVFEPEQIKSAIGNAGTFDPQNSDIRASRAELRPGLGKLNAAQEKAARAVLGDEASLTLKEKFDRFRADIGIRSKQALVDQFARIADYDQKAYMLARMSKATDGQLEATLVYGKPELRDGVGDVKIGEGFAAVLAGLQGEHDRFLLWVAAQRAERLKAVGLENLFGAQDIAVLKTLNQGNLQDGTSRQTAFNSALAKLNEFNDAVLKIAEDSGLIDPAARALFKNVPYVPFYRVMEDGEGVTGPKFSGGLVNAQAWKKLKGGKNKLNGDLLSNVLMNWSHLFQAAARNRAAMATMKAAIDAGVAYPVAPGTKDSVKIRGELDNGNVINGGLVQEYAIEDPYLLEAVAAVNYMPPNNPFFRGMVTMKRMLSFGVTLNPAYKIRNLIRDSVSAMALADLSPNVLSNWKRGWNATRKDNQTYASMMAAGGLMRFGSVLDSGNTGSEPAQRMVRKLGGEVLDASAGRRLLKQMQDVFDVYQEFGDRGEQMNRAALYERLIDKGYSHADAAFAARDLMDFSMSGASPTIRFLTQTVPFLNARLQGLYKLGRSAKQDPKRFAAITGAVALASIALWAHYKDDEDWQKREDWDRDTYWWFKIGEKVYRVPKPFEIGSIGTVAERTFELMFDENMTGERMGQTLSRMLLHTFAFDPTPQIVKPLVDLFANKDSFTGRPIEGTALEKVLPEDRSDQNTSAIANVIGQLGLPNPADVLKGHWSTLSPKQTDHLIRAYFGWFGTSMANLSTYMQRAASDVEAPDLKLKDIFLVGSFVETLPSGSSRYVTQMYEQAKEIEQVWNSYQAAVKSGDIEKAEELREDRIDDLRAYRGVQEVKEREAEINAAIKRIQKSAQMDGTEKRRLIDELEQRRSDIAEPFVRSRQ